MARLELEGDRQGQLCAIGKKATQEKKEKEEER
jgi:hypothetical protein